MCTNHESPVTGATDTGVPHDSSSNSAVMSAALADAGTSRRMMVLRGALKLGLIMVQSGDRVHSVDGFMASTSKSGSVVSARTLEN